MKALGRRLRRIEEREQLRAIEHGPSYLIVRPDEWPEAACRAYDALRAGEDVEAWADLLERHAGQRPGPRTRVIALRLWAGGPHERADKFG